MPHPVLTNGGTSVEWALENPILPANTTGTETDTSMTKIGNGSSYWNSLKYTDEPSGPDILALAVSNAINESDKDVNIGVDSSHNWGEQTAAEAGKGLHYFPDTELIDYSTGEQWLSEAGKISTKDAVHEWWIQPIATYLESPYPRIVYGAISSIGEILACEFNGVTKKSTRVVTAIAQIDDHNVPALYAEAGRRFLLAWSNHNADAYINFMVSGISGDVKSFARDTKKTFTSTGLSSYVQIAKIDSLSSADEDVFYVFNRLASTSWQIIPVTVTQSTGAITFGTTITVFTTTSPQLFYISVADEHATSGQILRVAVGYNPSGARSELYGFKINVVTGAITNVVDPSFTANLSGTNLPIDVSDTGVVTYIPRLSAPNDDSRRLFYPRPGPATFGIAYADWTDIDPDNAVYHVAESPVYNNGGLKHTATDGAGYASAAYNVSMAVAKFRLETFFTFSDAPTSAVELARRADTLSAGNWVLSVRADRTVRVFFIYTSTTGEALSSGGTKPIPGLWTQKTGLRITANYDATPKVKVEYSLDDGSTWTLLDSGNPGAYTVAGFKTASDPIVVPSAAVNADAEKLTVHNVIFSNETGVTVIADADFINDWPTGDTTYTDDQSIAWSITGEVSVNNSDTLRISDYGISGARVGYTAEANYIGGMSFPDPCEFDIVYTAHSANGQETIVKNSALFGNETIAEASTSSGRLIRPYSPHNNGPFEIVYTDMKSYSSVNVTEFKGDIKII